MIKYLYKIIMKIRKKNDFLINLYNKLWNKYILKDRLLIYWLFYRVIDSLKMESSPWTYETIIKILLETNNNKNIKILDFGSWNHNSYFLRKLWLNVISSDVINYWWENFILLDKTKKEIPFVNNEFDISICSEVLEHVYSPFIILEELIRVTKKKIIITTPNIRSIKSRIKFLTKWYYLWFEEKDFDYHKTPIPSWQIENFLNEKSIKYNVYWNTEIFWLKWNKYLNSEILIYEIFLN